jgi:hypothetical protein
MTESNKTAKFAQDFMPTFPASKLGDFCGNQSEATRIKFLRQHRPFSLVSSVNLVLKENSKPKKNPSKSLLSESEKNFLKSKINKSINTNNLTFDDEKVIEDFLIIKEKSSQEINECVDSDKDENYLEQNKKEDSSILELPNPGENNYLNLEKELQTSRYISFNRGRIME